MMSCADLFCGAGGFSEGFRQAGFRVTKALDLWKPAVLTHQKNHPETEAIEADILSFKPEDLGPIDVLIGSPPCTEFSFANRGGGGDIEAGMRLVYRFLRFVYELQPRWWVMENVPRTLDLLPAEVPLRRLGVDKKGSLEIPVRTVLVSADYGAPQKRARAFSGNFPLPRPTHGEGRSPWRTLRDVVEGLPDPLHRLPLGSSVDDPVYGFELASHLLTDHFSASLDLTSEEVRENRKAKEDHSWYGRMSFPDELDRPARTVMATQLRVSRETTVIASSSGGFRRLSVREASSVQGFPITYQWWGKSEGLKYKLVGNAVAPPVSHAVARAILTAARKAVPASPQVITAGSELAPEVSRSTKGERQLPLDRRFREHVPGSKLPGFRVDFDNSGKRRISNPGWLVGSSHPQHLAEWRAVLYRGSGKSLKASPVGLMEALRLLAQTIADERSRTRAELFVRELQETLGPRVPDSSTLQAIRGERLVADTTPYVLLESIAAVVERHYAARQTVIPLARSRSDLVPPRIAATLVATAYVCDVANRGALWQSLNRTDAYSPSPLARASSPTEALEVSLRLDGSFRRALRRYRPRRMAAGLYEVEQLTIAGA